MPKQMRTTEEAWELALENKGLMYSILHHFLGSHYNVWYTRDALFDELESWAWEGMYFGCLYWDEDQGALSTYVTPAVERKILRGYERLLRMGTVAKGNYPKGESKGKVSVYALEDITPKLEEIVDTDYILSNYPQPWEEEVEESFEGDLVEMLDFDTLWMKLFQISEKMEEPYRTVFQLSHLLPRETEFPSGANPKTMHGATHSYKEVSEMIGMHKASVREVLLEAEEFVRFQLETEGVSYDAS